MKFFKEHLEDIDESYFKHMVYAISYSLNLFLAGACCMLHAFFPFLCKEITSDIISSINESIKYRGDEQ
jgi:hypothetical protein